jgi:anti-sigma factor RsiW
MSCGKMKSRILEYLDGRLKESEKLEVEKHLASCAPCSVRVNEFRAVSGLLDELPVIEPSPEFDLRVHALVAAEPVKESWWAWLRVSPRVAFAASMLLLAALWMGHWAPNNSALPPMDMQQADAQMLQDLPVLEDHDVLSNFEPLKDLPGKADDDSDNAQPQQQEQQQQPM